VTFDGGYVARYAYTLVLTCGPSTTGLNIVEDGSFPNGNNDFFITPTSGATQTLTFPAFTVTHGCLVTAYALDDDNNDGNGIISPVDASLPAVCGPTCLTITINTVAVQ